MSILELKNIRKSFDNKVVLDGIDLTVDQGEVVSILGPSGSGKSTLLRCATFLETADGGSIAYKDREVVKWMNREIPCMEVRQISDGPADSLDWCFRILICSHILMC